MSRQGTGRSGGGGSPGRREVRRAPLWPASRLMTLRWVLGGLVAWSWCLAGLALAQTTTLATGGVVVDLEVGKAGSISEMIRAPLAGRPLTDRWWIYERLPDGTPNPAYPPLPGPPSLPVQVGLPGVLVDLTGVWQGFPLVTPCQTPGRDTDHTAQEVLFPSVTLDVPANLPWVKSGFQVAAGQKFFVRATGQWSSHFDVAMAGPEGLGRLCKVVTDPQPNHPNPPVPCPTAPAGSLCARIGMGSGFLVGRGGTFTAAEGGELQFMCNDSFDGPEGYTPNGLCSFCALNGLTNVHLGNNQGSLRVTVSLAPIP